MFFIFSSYMGSDSDLSFHDDDDDDDDDDDLSDEDDDYTNHSNT